jgi:hypothetical protein
MDDHLYLVEVIRRIAVFACELMLRPVNPEIRLLAAVKTFQKSWPP